MELTVLSVAYPLAPVGPDAGGGAEQILSMLDAALVEAGHRSIVIACEGSRAAGTFVATPLPPQPFDAAARRDAQARTRSAISEVLRHIAVDVVHCHGIDFATYLPAEIPVLATLHLPLSWYSPESFAPRPGTWLNCVSHTQARAFPSHAGQPTVIENGIRADDFAVARQAGGFALALGRICPEKGFHLALEAARRADVPLLLAGPLFPYPEHDQYFRREIQPRLDARRRFIGPVGFARKRSLLAAASCLLVPSQAPETSSLVAMEAFAAGTPVVAFPAGALADIVEPGRTGFLVHDSAGMARAIAQAGLIDPDTCRESAGRRFSAERMTARYVAHYRRLAEAPRELCA